MHTKVDTLEYVRLLLDAGCPLNSFDRFGHSILMAVIRRNWQDGETVHEVDMQLSRIILNAGIYKWFAFLHNTSYLIHLQMNI